MAPRQIAEAWRRIRTTDRALLAVAFLVALSFAWLFYSQWQRAKDNHRTIMLATHVAYVGCLNDRRTGLTLRLVLARIRDNHQVPLTTVQIAERVRYYDALIRLVPVRDCKAEFSALPKGVVVRVSG